MSLKSILGAMPNNGESLWNVRKQAISPRSYNALQALRNLVAPVIAPLGTAGIVIVFTIFMLIEREEVRNRLFRLAGEGKINLMTKALDDAAQRVSRYLFLQLLVNASFGGIVGTGLFFIGVPNALLWGVLAGMLRFLPYVGPLIGGMLPLMLSLAVFSGWKEPMLTVGLFVVTELVVATSLSRGCTARTRGSHRSRSWSPPYSGPCSGDQSD